MFILQECLVCTFPFVAICQTSSLELLTRKTSVMAKQQEFQQPATSSSSPEKVWGLCLWNFSRGPFLPFLVVTEHSISHNEMVPVPQHLTLHFFPLSSLRPLHFPLPSKHPPRTLMPESKTCNAVLWAQLLKQNALNHMGLQGAPCSHIMYKHEQTHKLPWLLKDVLRRK